MTKTEQTIPAQSVGIGLKPVHYREALGSKARSGGAGVDFFEVHAENFMGAGGPPHAWLAAVCEKFPLSVHGVSLSLAGVDPLNGEHLARLKTVVDRYNPAIVSEHLAWGAHDGIYYHDLLAPPVTRETFRRLSDNVKHVQDVLGRRILIENPSQYLDVEAEIPLPDALNELARDADCGLLLDINNAYVSACNLGFDASHFLDAIDPAFVGEIHLAGHAVDRFDGFEIRVDDHGSRVCEAVGELYSRFVERAGPRPTLVEWDTDVPAFDILLDEAARARRRMNEAAARASKKVAEHV